ncbi:MAG: hypothetical protein AAFZ02_08400 [Pseudomonadota bacterium]
MLNTLAQFYKAARPRDFALVKKPTRLQDLSRVEQHLPEIIGRALARSWIDPAFASALLNDPKGLLADYDVFLPVNVALSIEGRQDERPRVVVSERVPGKRARRLMYLQLVMVAGR